MKDKEAQSLVDYAALFEEESREAGLGYSRMACLLAGVLTPLFGALDLVVYPHLFKEFMILRLVCTLVLTLNITFFHCPISLSNVGINDRRLVGK